MTSVNSTTAGTANPLAQALSSGALAPGAGTPSNLSSNGSTGLDSASTGGVVASSSTGGGGFSNGVYVPQANVTSTNVNPTSTANTLKGLTPTAAAATSNTYVTNAQATIAAQQPVYQRSQGNLTSLLTDFSKLAPGQNLQITFTDSHGKTQQINLTSENLNSNYISGIVSTLSAAGTTNIHYSTSTHQPAGSLDANGQLTTFNQPPALPKQYVDELNSVTNQLTASGSAINGANQVLSEYTSTGNQATTQAGVDQASKDAQAQQTLANQNTQALAQQLAGINAGAQQQLQTDTGVAAKGLVAQEQTAGNAHVNLGSALAAAGQGAAEVGASGQQSLNVAKAAVTDQSATQIGAALSSAFKTAQAQTGLQLQTMNQQLSDAIAALQEDAQNATGQQAVNIQAYIDALKTQQAQLQNAVGQSGANQTEVVQVAQSVGAGVSAAGSVYASSQKKSAT